MRAAGVAREIRAHVPEPFWYIHVSYRAPEGQACAFTWARGHIYDHAVATVLYETCVDAPLATVTRASHSMHSVPCTAGKLRADPVMGGSGAGMLQSRLLLHIAWQRATHVGQANCHLDHILCSAWT